MKLHYAKIMLKLMYGNNKEIHSHQSSTPGRPALNYIITVDEINYADNASKTAQLNSD